MFYRDGDHLYLHSFPTRRSSDLQVVAWQQAVDALEAGHRAGQGEEREGVVDAARVRSEEHTSELQSQFHIVCRLLLEKKKQLYLSDLDWLRDHRSVL